MNDVCLDGAERLVFDDNEDLLLFLQVDEVTKPGFFGKSVGKDKNKNSLSAVSLYCCMHLKEFVFLPLFLLHFTHLSIYLSIHKNGEKVKSSLFLSAALGKWK